MPKRPTTKSARVTAENVRRLRYIRSVLAMGGKTLRDVARAYRREGGGQVHESLVYRVARGERRSYGVEQYIARSVGHRHQDLFL